MPTITVNGDRRPLGPDPSLLRLIADLALENRRLAVELNGEIVPRSRYPATTLRDGDQVEIVQAIGGG